MNDSAKDWAYTFGPVLFFAAVGYYDFGFDHLLTFMFLGVGFSGLWSETRQAKAAADRANEQLFKLKNPQFDND